MSGDESKTRGFWKDNRVVMIMLALVCVAAFSIFAYCVHRHRVSNETISGVDFNEVPKDVPNEILTAEVPFETRVANLVSELGKLGVEDKNACRELFRQAQGLVGDLENAFKKNE
eukprot:179054_1